MPTFIENPVKLLRQSECVDETVLTCSSLAGNHRTHLASGSSLAGNHRTHLASGSAGIKTSLLQICNKRIDVRVRNTLDFKSQTCCHRHFPASEPARGFSDGYLFCRREFAVPCYHPHIEMIGLSLVLKASQAVPCYHPHIEMIGLSLVLKASQTFHPLHFLRRDNGAEIDSHIIEGKASLKHPCIRVSVILQAVLEEISPHRESSFQA